MVAFLSERSILYPSSTHAKLVDHPNLVCPGYTVLKINFNSLSQCTKKSNYHFFILFARVDRHVEQRRSA